MRSISRPRSAVSSKYSDSGVVTRMCGGVRSIVCRSAAGVSPVRTARGSAAPGGPALRPARGCRPAAPSRFLWMSFAQRLERRDVDDLTSSGKPPAQPLADELVDRDQKRRQRLARTGRRRDQRMAPRLDRRPSSPCAPVGARKLRSNSRQARGENWREGSCGLLAEWTAAP